jgi:L-asparaginase
MFANIKLLYLFAAVGSASPIVYPRTTNDTNPFVFTNSNGLNFTQMNITLPNVTIFATGKCSSFS